MAEMKGTAEPTPPATVEAKPPAKMTWDEFRGLVKRVEKGDRKCLPQLREALKSGDYPKWSRWFRDTLGNPATWLKDSLARMAGGESNLAVWGIRSEDGPAPPGLGGAEPDRGGAPVGGAGGILLVRGQHLDLDWCTF
jgi:hypothetical protein